MAPRELASQWIDDLVTAFALLTRLPLPRFGFESAESARATRAYPLAGLAIGVLGGIAFALADALGLPALVCALLAVAATALVGGCLHEDGLADSADALGGRSLERRLEILRDSRTGAFGALALVFSVALRAAALAALLDWSAALAALIAAHALSRGLLPPIMASSPFAHGDGLAVATGRPDHTTATIAAGLGALIALVALGWSAGVAAILIAAALTFGLRLFALARFGGVSGDILGACQQLLETAILLVAAAFVWTTIAV
ncbi:MAG: adenosylcobinamide-GDP ribazoletransferase [Kiloniellales bacterium]